jgi:lysylphosphatidylglycerol synthetase-like protein (DUF2156 family)
MPRDKLVEWLKKYSHSSASYLTLSNDIKYFSVDSIDGYIGYVKHANVAVALGEPICSASNAFKLIHEFKLFCINNKWQICFFGCSENNTEIFRGCGFKAIYIGSEPFVALDKFTITGSKMCSVRRGINHAKRAGVCIEECFYNNDKFKNELEAVTKDWLHTKKMPELSFMVGRLSFDPERRYFVARRNEQIVAFAIYNPIYALKSYYLDLNRRRREAPNGTMEYLLVSSFEKLKHEGMQKIYFGLSPFSNAQAIANNHPFIARLMKFLYKHFDFFYPAESEYFFKRKLSTDCEMGYLWYYPRISLRMLYGIFLSFCPGGIKEMISYKLSYALRKRLK